jgi:ADP-ribosylglycohydrolase
MIGAVAGDIIGSIYERNPIKTEDFPLFHTHSRFTDDSVMSLAVAQAIMREKKYGREMKSLGQVYPNAGYGGNFRKWIFEPGIVPYNSWGNGSAMRVSPVGFAFDSPEEVLREARASAEVSHDHPEGIKGAQAIALAIYFARQGYSKDDIRTNLTATFFYDLDRTVEEIRPDYQFDVSCMGSVPEAIIAFLDSADYESAVRKAVSLGGDSDTQACIAGAIAEAYYKSIPSMIIIEVERILPENLWKILNRFEKDHPCCDLGI